jgi:phosphoribosyl-ATP pyrophosphohydrolase/phosphoribosyl-AMP cyclohydrolase
MDISELKFDAQGLIPCIVQDAANGRVLMMAYMNKESIEITLAEQRTCFWSRSRGELWRKGETSGNVQHLVSLAADCDNDTLLAQVQKDGPACHTGAESCFFQTLQAGDSQTGFSLRKLYDLLEERERLRPEESYTSYLFEKGREKILKKIGEECAEVIIGAMKDSREEMVYEIADLTYHVLVLMVEAGVSPEDILLELESRHVIDKKVKQETMK